MAFSLFGTENTENYERLKISVFLLCYVRHIVWKFVPRLPILPRFQTCYHKGNPNSHKKEIAMKFDCFIFISGLFVLFCIYIYCFMIIFYSSWEYADFLNHSLFYTFYLIHDLQIIRLCTYTFVYLFIYLFVCWCVH